MARVSTRGNCQYQIVSTEGDSAWAKMTTNGQKALDKASTLMVKRMIPDIEAYVLTLPSTAQPAAM